MRALSDDQLKAVEKLKRLKVGALFLGCGCGKTQTAVSLINSVEDVDLLLWVCPCQTKKNVAEELEKCDCRYPAFIVGVESIGQSDRTYLDVLNRVTAAKKAFIIVDESIKIKNYNAQRTKRMNQIGRYAEYKLILNGTPVTKNIVDVFEQMNFLSPKIFRNMSFYKFRENYCKYTQIKKGKFVIKTIITGYDNIDHMLSLIDPYIYQCELKMSQKRKYKTVYWNMTFEEHQNYAYTKWSLLEKYANNENPILATLSELHHSYCCCEDKFDKIECLLNNKTLVFCKYIRSKEELEKRFPGVMVITYGTGSLGLNLQQYNRIIYFDKTFDYAFREQSEARIYRTGQQDDCEYYDLTGDVGLEDMIDECISKKLDLVEHFKTTMPKIKDL